jgi:oligopeptidase A
MTTTQNPLLDFSGMPRFDAFTPECVAPAIDSLLADANAVVAQLLASRDAPTWANFVTPLDDTTEKISRAWGIVSHLNLVANSPALREAYNAQLPLVTAFWTALSLNESLFAKYQQIRASPASLSLSAAQNKTLDNVLRDFRLGGAELEATVKPRFKDLQESLSTLSAKFNDNILDATNAYALYVEDENELAGIPADVLHTAKAAAEADGKAGWKLTLHAPCLMPVLQYTHSQPLREKMYHANVTRASDLGAAAFDNTAHILDIVAKRGELSGLLGFENFTALSLAPKMAQSSKEVFDFLNDMVNAAKPFALNDFAELQSFAKTELNMGTVNAWDVGYVSERLRVSRYAFSEQEVRQYFPEDAVLTGLFKLLHTIYGITFKAAKTSVWHSAVQFFDLFDRNQNLIGHVYLDLYANLAKRGGAWMDSPRSRRKVASGMQLPIAYLNCNFAAPVDGKPALFTHNNVITLFHEFGHGLHHLLTHIDELGVSGIAGVEWDAVELPSQFMENFCWEPSVLADMTRHVDTGAALPAALLQKMLAAKNFQAGMATVRQLEFALIDMHLHTNFKPSTDGAMAVNALLSGVRSQVAVMDYPYFNRFLHQFSHIFGGGYAAGYYSYMWARVLSADAYSAFEEQGVLNPAVGQKFWDELLGRGGSRPAMESFIAFRGRAPTMDALMRHNGMLVV